MWMRCIRRIREMYRMRIRIFGITHRREMTSKSIKDDEKRKNKGEII